jgi:type I restriction enzyme S subunit
MLSAALGLSGEQLANFESLEGDTINIVKLSEACTFSRGLTYGKSDEVEFSSNVVLRANNIDLASNSLNLADLRFIKDSIRIKKEKIAKKDSIIICTASGSKSHVGKVALIDQDYGYAYGGFMGQLTPSDNCLSKYLYFILTSGTFKDFLMKLNDGTNINNLKFSDIEDYEFPLPTLEKQRVIVSKLDNAFAEIEKIKNQIAIKQDFAGMLRQSLLSDSFSPNLEKESV